MLAMFWYERQHWVSDSSVQCLFFFTWTTSTSLHWVICSLSHITAVRLLRSTWLSQNEERLHYFILNCNSDKAGRCLANAVEAFHWKAIWCYSKKAPEVKAPFIFSIEKSTISSEIFLWILSKECCANIVEDKHPGSHFLTLQSSFCPKAVSSG